MTTQLFILRHGVAEERDRTLFPDDALRPLTRRGTEKMHEIAAGMRGMGLEFGLILSSPYRRARQTAAIVAKEFGIPQRLRFSAHLEPGGDLAGLIEEVASASEEATCILLVGHEPSLSTLISLLVAGHEGAPVMLKKGGLCSLTLDLAPRARRATLQWLLTPRQLRRMAV
jgi:phosphohistidine phosphatase